MRNWTPCWVKSSFGSRSRSPRWPRARAFQEERALAKAGWKPAFRPKMRQCDNARMLAAKAGPRFRTAVWMVPAPVAHSVIVGDRPALDKVAREQEGSP